MMIFALKEIKTLVILRIGDVMKEIVWMNGRRSTSRCDAPGKICDACERDVAVL